MSWSFRRIVYTPHDLIVKNLWILYQLLILGSVVKQTDSHGTCWSLNWVLTSIVRLPANASPLISSLPFLQGCWDRMVVQIPIHLRQSRMFCSLTALAGHSIGFSLSIVPACKRLPCHGVHSHQLSIGGLHAILLPRQSCRRVGSLQRDYDGCRHANQSPTLIGSHTNPPRTAIGPAG